MKDPERLRVVPLAEDLAVQTYQVTRGFPDFERFGLSSQMQRAAVSIGSNIVEGCGQQGDRAFVSTCIAQWVPRTNWRFKAESHRAWGTPRHWN